jgi:aspartyl-tRNA(Asn)/glutamyl-tRNA(Gln) amidotransferase subunit C
MAISREEVEKISKLARLKFDDSEKQKLAEEMSEILNYVDQLKDVSSNARAAKEISHAEAIGSYNINLMRDDHAEPAEDPHVFIGQAPAQEKGSVKVKSILE